MLAHPLTGQSHPVYWWPRGADFQAAGSQNLGSQNTALAHVEPNVEPNAEPIWRLPAIVHLSPNFAQNEADAEIQLPIPGLPAAEGLLLRDLNLALSTGLPYPAGQGWKPLLQGYFSAAQPQRILPEPPWVSLHLIVRAVQRLLAELSNADLGADLGAGPAAAQQGRSPHWHCGAEGLHGERFQQIMAQLEGVVFNAPAKANEAYRFNLREAALGAGLVERAEQIAFLEEPIATLLAEFSEVAGRSSGRSDSVAAPSHWPGATLIIQGGPASMELGLVCLPSGLHNLTHADFKLRSFDYGVQAFQQDIACQLLIPFIPEDQLGLDLAILPIPGEPDATVRAQLQRQLYRSPVGKMLLDASAYLQQALQQQERMTFEFGPYACTFSQTAMDTKVTQPFVLRLGRELHRLLQESGLENSGVAQVLYSGSEALLPALKPWLEQMLPQADLRERVAGADVAEGQFKPPSRIVQGLSLLPFHGQVLDRSGQQYGHYFLLMEMLRSLPPEALTQDEILGHLESQGINTQSCHDRILDLLKGHIPTGLLPRPTDVWAMGSDRSTDYPDLQIKPLFHRLSARSFQLDPVQRQRWLDYWQRVTQQTHQTLTEPYLLELGVTV